MWFNKPEIKELLLKLEREETELSAQLFSQKSEIVIISVKPVKTIVTLAKNSLFSEY
jgi:hypothetical protein